MARERNRQFAAATSTTSFDPLDFYGRPGEKPRTGLWEIIGPSDAVRHSSYKRYNGDFFEAL